MIQAKFSFKAFYPYLFSIFNIIFAAVLRLWQLLLLPIFRYKLLESAELTDKDAFIKMSQEIEPQYHEFVSYSRDLTEKFKFNKLILQIENTQEV